eukprot:sb/3470791/
MIDELNVISTRYELENCSDEVLERSLSSVSREVVMEYIFHLRREIAALKLANINIPPAISGPTPPAGGPITASRRIVPEQEKFELSEEEIKASNMKSSRAQTKFTAHFTNQSSGPVNLIWKDYEGREVLFRRGIEPGVVHGEDTYLTHPFIVRDSVTKKLKRFNCNANSVKDVVFEGMSFGVEHFRCVIVEIVDEES